MAWVPVAAMAANGRKVGKFAHVAGIWLNLVQIVKSQGVLPMSGGLFDK